MQILEATQLQQNNKSSHVLSICNSCNCFYRFSATSTVSFNNSFLLFSRRFNSSRIILQTDSTIQVHTHTHTTAICALDAKHTKCKLEK